MATRRLEVEFVGDMTSLDKAFRKTRQQTQKTQGAVGGFGAVAAKAARGLGALGLAGGLAGAVKTGAAFEKQMSALSAVTGKGGRTMDRFRKQAIQAGADTAFSAKEAAEAQTELAKGGVRVRDIMKGGLKGALGLAAAGEMDLADAAGTVADALNLFGLRGRKAGHVADALAQAANATTADVSDFSHALRQGGAAAKAAGLKLDDTVTVLEALAAAGVKGSDAGTSMKAALTHLASPSSKAAKLMKDLGINFFDAKGNMKGVSDISAMLRDKLGGLTREQRLNKITTIAGTDGMRALLALYDAGPKKLQGYAKGLKKQGTAADVAAKKQDNLSGDMEKLGGSLETLAIQASSLVMPALRALAKGAAWAVDHIGPAISAVKGFFSGGGGLSSSDIDAVKGALDNLWKAAKGVFGFLKDVAERTLPGLKRMFGGVVQEIRGFVQVISGLLSGDFGKVWEGLKNIVGGAIDVLLGYLQSVTAPIREIAAKLGQAVIDGLKSIPGLLADVGKWYLDKLVDGIKLYLNSWKAIGGWVLEHIVAGVKAAGKAVADAAKWYLDTLVDGVKAYVRVWRNVGEWVLHRIVDGFRALADVVEGAARWLKERIVGFVKNAVDAFKALGSWVLDRIVDGFKVVTKLLGTVGGWVKDRIVDLVKGAKDGFLSLGSWVLDRLADGVTTVTDKLGGVGDWIFGKVKGFIHDVKDGFVRIGSSVIGWIVSGLKGGLNAVKGFVNDLIGALNWVLDKIGVAPIALLKIDANANGGVIGGASRAVQGFATGGEVRRGTKITRPMVMMGEEAPRHPEFVIPTNPAYRGRAHGLLASAAAAIGVPGFAMGGVLGGIGDVAGAVGGAVGDAAGWAGSAVADAARAVGGTAAAVANFAAEIAQKGVNWALSTVKGLLPDPDDLPTWLTGVGSFMVNKVWDWAKGKITALVGLGGGGGPAGGGGTSSFDGRPVANWIVPILQWARSHGWGGSVTSGWRSRDQQWAAAVAYGLEHYPNGNPFGSNHLSTAYPGGAVDVTLASQLAQVLTGYQGARRLVWGGPVIGDWVHFSATGHAKGGILGGMSTSLPFAGSFAGGGVVPGPAGAPRLAIVHGQEHIYDPTVSPAGREVVIQQIHNGDVVYNTDVDLEVVERRRAFQLQTALRGR